jgi:hypothetical protein
MTKGNKQALTGILVVILVLLAIAFMRDRAGVKQGFREGFDSTAGSAPRTP